ncbi:HNH endonuclease [Cupriavidus gilardii]|uniref:HNH endonuclease n=1 Tax=Cupriavidus gilardii TaxID=82541 RepID=A0ABY4VQH7_9BURK|nr:HNH endonuclease [Cupriavidus gilardii]USE79509.1 HNH endonuclease [Cupriavidus gilardii]
MKENQSVAQILAEYSVLMERRTIAHIKPLVGGIWGDGEFWNAVVSPDGFETRYLVVDRIGATVIGVGQSPIAAREIARWAVAMFGGASVLADAVKERAHNIRAQQDDEWSSVAAQIDRIRQSSGVTSRRLKVFEKSKGVCHYCAKSIDLHGDWHVEHMTPKARGGSNDITNLVAACNSRKGTKTADEFMASL